MGGREGGLSGLMVVFLCVRTKAVVFSFVEIMQSVLFIVSVSAVQWHTVDTNINA